LSGRGKLFEDIRPVDVEALGIRVNVYIIINFFYKNIQESKFCFESSLLFREKDYFVILFLTRSGRFEGKKVFLFCSPLGPGKLS